MSCCRRSIEAIGDAVSASSKFWLLYTAAWAPLAVVYGVLIAQRGVPPAIAATSGITTVVPAAAFGAIVYLVVRRLGAQDPGRFWLAATHIALAVVYSTLWSGTILAMMWIDAPEAARADFIRNALGWQFLSGLMVYGVIAGIAATGQAWERVREQERMAARSDALRAKAELHALRAQLDPHFLFNTLHSLMALVRADARAAEQAVERFGDLLRYVLDVNRERRDEAPLADELAFVRSYLALEQLRLGDRLRASVDVDADLLDALVPTFALQPLVENAIRHAIAPHARGGSVTIAARADGTDRLRLEVGDDGPGATRDRALDASGVGLRVLGQRLQVLYGDAARFDVATGPGKGFAVTISLPLRASNASGPGVPASARSARSARSGLTAAV
jgi:signal transduction histidine kinase